MSSFVFISKRLFIKLFINRIVLEIWRKVNDLQLESVTLLLETLDMK